MELQALTEFLALADTLNYSRAAARLHMSSAALTRHIQKLESLLGVTLVDRSPPLSLTAAGRELFPKAEKLVRDMERLKREMAQSGHPHQTTLNIGFIPGTLHLSLTGALDQFRKNHPSVRAQLHELSPCDQVSALRNEVLDVAIIGQPWRELTHDFDLFDLGSVPLCAVLSGTHPLTEGGFDLKDLRDEEFIGLCREIWPGQAATVTAACREAGFEPNFTATAHGKCALLIMVGASHRVGLLPATANLIPHAGAAFHPLSCQVRCCAAVRPAERRPAVREFLQGLQREFRKVAHSFGFPTVAQPVPVSHDRKKIDAPVSSSIHVA